MQQPNILSLKGLSTHDPTYDREELAISYRWTGWVLINNRWKFKTAGKLPIILEEFMRYTPI